MEPLLYPVYILRDDQEGIEQMQRASLSDGELGLKQTHGLVGSDGWWAQIEQGALPLHKVRGTVSRFWPGHHGDWPEFELQEANGMRSMWDCMVPAGIAGFRFAVGTAVEVAYVEQELKAREGPSKLIVELRCS